MSANFLLLLILKLNSYPSVLRTHQHYAFIIIFIFWLEFFKHLCISLTGVLSKIRHLELAFWRSYETKIKNVKVKVNHMCCFLIILKTYPHGTEENETNLVPSCPQIVFPFDIAFRSHHKLVKWTGQGLQMRKLHFRSRTLSSHSRLEKNQGSQASTL